MYSLPLHLLLRYTVVCHVTQEASTPHCEYIDRKKENAIFISAIWLKPILSQRYPSGRWLCILGLYQHHILQLILISNIYCLFFQYEYLSLFSHNDLQYIWRHSWNAVMWHHITCTSLSGCTDFGHEAHWPHQPYITLHHFYTSLS